MSRPRLPAPPGPSPSAPLATRVLADRPHGPPVTLHAARCILMRRRERRIGPERCGSGATSSLHGPAAEGAATEGCGQKLVCANRGGIPEPHGRHCRSRALLDRTLHPGRLRHGPGSAERRWGSRGLSLSLLDGGTARHGSARLGSARLGTARLLAGALPQPPAAGLSALLAPQPPAGWWRPSWGTRPPAASTPETRLLRRDRLGSSGAVRRRYRCAS
ncbi:cell migration-inducing and hyaluronan-binding protein-like isoform X2 [Agelaius phoeniceus]|uniref:cell migration-inducing and hyaluronan-binding protein-like isoform X2 n=1 Tax=Agelaius phoeniceus TaxID=39638 RepID=UPI004054B3A0